MNQSTLATGAIVAYHEMDCVELAATARRQSPLPSSASRQPPPTAPLSLASRTASHCRPHLCGSVCVKSQRQPPPVAPPATAPQPSATADRTSVSRKSHRQPPPTAPLSVSIVVLMNIVDGSDIICLLIYTCSLLIGSAFRDGATKRVTSLVKSVVRSQPYELITGITSFFTKQVFSPNYTLPPARSNPDVLAIDIRSIPKPVFEFYIDVLINGEIVILISIYHKETYVKTKARSIRNNQALVLKREHVYGGKLYTTKANFSGKEKRISTDCWVEIKRQRKEWKWSVFLFKYLRTSTIDYLMTTKMGAIFSPSNSRSRASEMAMAVSTARRSTGADSNSKGCW
nr:NADPH oxidase [Ipomoea batatas]